MKTYYVYILTNSNRTVLYIGVTNDLLRRVFEHHENTIDGKGFTGQYKVCHLVYWEEYNDVNDAIAREKQLKGISRAKKEALIATKNPKWTFLETEL